MRLRTNGLDSIGRRWVRSMGEIEILMRLRARWIPSRELIG